MSYRFPKSVRLRKRREYLEVQDRGQKLHGRHFLLMLWQTDETCPGKLGITVSKKVGSAVVRNRVKRIVREGFRCCSEGDCLPNGMRAVVVAKKSAAKHYKVHQSNVLFGDLAGLGRRLARCDS